MRTRHALTASAAAATFDWNARGPFPELAARAQFMSQVVEGIGGNTGYMTGHIRTSTDPQSLIEHDGWALQGDWRFGHGDRSLIARHNASGKVVYLAYDADNQSLSVELSSPNGHADAHETVQWLLGQCKPLAIEAQDDIVEVKFWSNSAFGPQSYVREFDAPEWSSVVGNYEPGVREQLNGLHAWSTQPNGGRLLLAHGPAGTGKTTAVRTLARAWKSWCDVNYIVDPEEFFGDASYMISVLLGWSEPGRSRLIVVEDCDELLTTDAKSRSGQAVSRLLNVCDGLVGQGLKVLLYLTTNESVENFHSAIVRPGRCLSNMNFGEFDADAADVWRTDNGLEPNGEAASLAQLYSEHRDALGAKASRVASRVRASS